MESQHLSDERMARLVGVSGATINRIRRGLNKPSASTMVGIAETTRGAVNVADFFPFRGTKIS